MSSTRSFKALVQRHVAVDPSFGTALLREGIDTMLTGDVDTGKAVLGDCGFRENAAISIFLSIESDLKMNYKCSSEHKSRGDGLVMKLKTFGPMPRCQRIG